MSEEQPLLVRREGPLVRAVMNRPHRRNAMIASTALAQRRAELNEVEEYLASFEEDGDGPQEEDPGSPEGPGSPSL